MYVLDTPGVFFAKHVRYGLKLALTGKILEHAFFVWSSINSFEECGFFCEVCIGTLVYLWMCLTNS